MAPAAGPGSSGSAPISCGCSWSRRRAPPSLLGSATGSWSQRQWLPLGLRLPPRDVDDVVAQLLIERQLGQALSRSRDLELLSR